MVRVKNLGFATVFPVMKIYVVNVFVEFLFKSKILLLFAIAFQQPGSFITRSKKSGGLEVKVPCHHKGEVVQWRLKKIEI